MAEFEVNRIRVKTINIGDHPQGCIVCLTDPLTDAPFHIGKKNLLLIVDRLKELDGV